MSTVASASPLPETPSEKARHAKKTGVILPWPQKPSTGSQAPIDDMWSEDTDKIMHRLDQQAPSTPSRPAAHESLMLLFKRPSTEKMGLRDEFPRALQAYDLVLAQIREHFPTLSVKKTLEIAPLEYAVSTIVASLERNRDALLCLAKIRQPSVYIYAHAINVCIYSAAFALDCGKSCSEAVATGLGGLLHDTGMTLLPLALLQSPQQLSATEQVLMKRHPVFACELFAGIPNIHNEILYAALEHHERFDGKGYPAGRSGSEISFMGHLAAIAGAFNAMTTPRRHRVPVSATLALGEMFKQKNKQFHPGMLESFIKMVGIYPVGSAVVLEDGYCGVVSASSEGNPARPVITLVQDPKGHPMAPLELDMSKELVANIVQCISPGEKGLDIHKILGIPDKDPL